MQQLEERWQHLDTLSQEQMTRLRVSAVFHRTMEEQCQKLKDLKAIVSTVSDVNDKEQQMYDLRMHLLSRENLIMEVGRMVRLGRLLKSRLKEPFKTDGTPMWVRNVWRELQTHLFFCIFYLNLDPRKN